MPPILMHDMAGPIFYRLYRA